MLLPTMSDWVDPAVERLDGAIIDELVGGLVLMRKIAVRSAEKINLQLASSPPILYLLPIV